MLMMPMLPMMIIASMLTTMMSRFLETQNSVKARGVTL